MCPAHCSQEAAWDHARDLRKHDFPIRLDPKPTTTALEIAILVKAVDLTMGAGLIEQYARTAASEARLDQCNITSNRILAAIESPLSRKEPVTP